MPAEVLPGGGGEERRAAPRRQPVDRNVAERLADGAALAASTASRLVTLADRVDSFLYGKRLRILVIAAAGVVTAASLSSGELAWLQPLAISIFVVLGLVLLVARVAMFRDDDGKWSPSVGWSNLTYAVIEFGDGIRRLSAAPTTQRLQAAGNALLGTALVTLALRVVFDRIYATGLDSWDFDWRDSWDYGVFLLGLALWLWGTWARRREGERSALIADPDKDRARVSQVATAFAELPAVIDCRAGLTPGAPEPTSLLLNELLTVPRSWRPRRGGDEKRYQYLLHRRLCEQVPKADPRREVPLRS